MLRELMAPTLILMLGFATGGLVTSAYRLFTQGQLRFRADFSTPGATLWSIALSAFGGPMIVAVSSWRSWERRALPVPGLVLAILLATIWSFCAGVVVLQLLVLAGLVRI